MDKAVTKTGVSVLKFPLITLWLRLWMFVAIPMIALKGATKARLLYLDFILLGKIILFM